MLENPLTHYLLLLATDASEVARFRSGGDAARESMAAAGLTDPKLQNVLLHGTQAEIDTAVSNELIEPQTASEGQTMRVQFTSLIQRMASPPSPPEK